MTPIPRFYVLSALVILGCPANEEEPSSDTDATTGDVDTTAGDPVGPVTPELIASRGTCPDIVGEGVTHSGDITADETWVAADGPHRITYHLRVHATLTIEPCALVTIDPGMLIEIGGSTEIGRVVANGEADGDDVRPINFRAAQDGDPWGEIYLWPTGELELSIAEIDGAGANADYGSALVVHGVAGGTNGGEPVESATLDRVLITDAVGHGLELSGWGSLTESSHDVWIRGCGAEAVRIEPGVAASLPTGLEVEGNARDEILMATSKAFSRDDTIRDLGVPYRQRGLLYLAPGIDGAPVTLTIEPGVIIAFEESAGTGIMVGSSAERQGVLVAEGTADAPILFTSGTDAPAAGDWMGIVFRYVPLAGNHISFAHFEYAGAESGHNSFGCGPRDNDAAIIVYGQGEEDVAPAPVVDNSSFDHIGGETVIVSGWFSDDGPNLAESNTFGAVTPSCKVSRPARTGAGDVCDGGRDMCWG